MDDDQAPAATSQGAQQLVEGLRGRFEARGTDTLAPVPFDGDIEAVAIQEARPALRPHRGV